MLLSVSAFSHCVTSSYSFSDSYLPKNLDRIKDLHNATKTKSTTKVRDRCDRLDDVFAPLTLNLI